MSEEIEFNIKPYKTYNLFSSLFYGHSSWSNLITNEIFIYYHGDKEENNIAWRILIFDVDHECLHEIIRKFISKETSIALDSLIGLEMSKYLYKDLFNDFSKLKNGLIQYKNGYTMEEHNNEK